MINRMPYCVSAMDWPRAMDRLWDQFFPEARAGALASRVWQRGDAVVVQVDVPGFRREEIKLTLEDRQLTLQAEVGEGAAERRHLGSYRAAWRLGPEHDVSRLEARLADGVLEVVVPKVAAAAGGPRVIEIATN